MSPEKSKPVSGNKPLFDNIGNALRKNPNFLDVLPIRDRYILLAHSDIAYTKTEIELAAMFDISIQRVGQLYNRAVRKVVDPWETRATPSTRGESISRAMIAKWQDPDFKKRAVNARQEKEHKRDEITRNTKLITAYEIYPEDQDIWNYVIDNQLADSLVTKGLLEESDMKTLSTYFSGQGAPKNIEPLLNRLSIAVAKLG